MKRKIFYIALCSTAIFFVGCNQQPKPKAVQVLKKPEPKKSYVTPVAPKKIIELKEVEDDNFSSEYMYPDAKKKETAQITENTTPATSEHNLIEGSMTNSECIAMIGQEKFDQYSEMYGGTSAALKKCKMLKAL